MPPPVFRFAPSPNGYLHLGHAFSALLNFDLAKEAGGRLLLRIDDIDASRCRPEYEAAIYEDLAWLGLEWERPVRRQSEHLDAYRAALAKLEAMQLTFASFESRAEIERLVADRQSPTDWPRDPDGAPIYPADAKLMSAAERARRMATAEPYALRLDMSAALSFLTSPLAGEVARRSDSAGEREGGKQQTHNSISVTPLPNPPPQGGREQKTAVRESNLTWSESGAGPHGETGLVRAHPAAWGDVVLARKDTPASYHLAVVVDDAEQGVTHVVRGADLYRSTDLHRLLQELLELPAPVYGHHKLILGADGRKLSKSTLATGLRELRAQGATVVAIRKLVGLD